MAARLLLADDHPIVRAGIRKLVGSHHRIVAEAEDGAAAVELARQHAPDVAILDLSMPRLSGLEAIRRIRAATPTRCLAYSVHEDRTHVRRALEAGAHGYLTKASAATELLVAIDAIVGGRTHVSPSVAPGALDAILRPEPRGADGFRRLTGREREVLQLVTEGLSTREIAGQLDLSAKTIETHRSHVMRKLQVRKVSQLVRVALQEGLVSLPQPGLHERPPARAAGSASVGDG